MNRRLRRLLPALAFSATVWLLPAVAMGQSAPAAAGHSAPTASERALARQLFHQGLAAADQNQWADARDDFQRAYDLVQSPVILFNLTAAQAKTGELVEAAENLRRFLRESTTGRAAQRRGDAQRQLADLEARTPSIELSVTGFASGDTVRIDGVAQSAAVLNAPLPIDPGHHRIRVMRTGRSVGELSFSVAERERRQLSMHVPPPPVPTPSAVARQYTRSSGQGTRSSAVATGGGGTAGGSRGETHSGGVLASPVFWVVVGVVVAAGAGTAIYFATRTSETPFNGTLDTVHFQ